MTADSLIEHSRAFAIRAHEAVKHRRKYTDEAYATHLEAVANLVEGVAGTPEMIAAAWLHDVVEDTPVTFAEIDEEFGPEVAQLVRQLTDVSKLEDGNRAIRKALDRAHLAQASPEAKTVKLADLIDNAQSIIDHDPRFARTFMVEKRHLLDVLREGAPALCREANEIVRDFFGSALEG